MKTYDKNKILELKSQNLTYKEIAKIIGCSLGTVHYHCMPNRIVRHRKSAKKYFQENPLMKKMSAFRQNLYKKHKQFNVGTNNRKKSFKLKDLIMKIGDNPKCYLTHTPINLEDRPSYSLDHIIPSCKGGANTLDNVGLCRRDINQAKYDKTPEEFFALCKEVLEANGYKVEKIS